MQTILWIVLFVASSIIAAPVPANTQLITSAEYYFAHQDYTRSFELWSRYRQLHPENFQAAMRVSDLKLYFEGRDSAVKELQKYSALTGAVLNAEHRRLVREKHYSLATTFLTDEGQSLYFRGVQREKLGDASAALSLFQQSAPLEKGNFLVLKARARAEKMLAMRERMYESLIAARDVFPFDNEVLENLFELQVFLGAPAELVASLKKNRLSLFTPRQKLAIAVAQAEAGDASIAMSLFQELVSKEKQITVHPISYFYLGKLHASRAGHSQEAVYFLERFKIALSRPESLLIEGWDPYRSTERAEIATKLMSELRPR